MSLQAKLRRLGEILAAAAPSVYHYWRPQMDPPYCVWAEDGEDGSLPADNRKGEQSVSGYVDYYTRTEFDPVLDQIQDALNSVDGFPFGWQLSSVDYEDETNLIHYQWTWSMV